MKLGKPHHQAKNLKTYASEEVKGGLISEGIFNFIQSSKQWNKSLLKIRKFQKDIVVSAILQKKQRNFSIISALASKKWLNQKNKSIFFC